VAEILDVQLGWIIIFGIAVGLPVAVVAGPIFGKYIRVQSKKVIGKNKDLISKLTVNKSCL
jgi:Gnt-I system low-affinity gluconate transporter